MSIYQIEYTKSLINLALEAALISIKNTTSTSPLLWQANGVGCSSTLLKCTNDDNMGILLYKASHGIIDYNEFACRNILFVYVTDEVNVVLHLLRLNDTNHIHTAMLNIHKDTYTIAKPFPVPTLRAERVVAQIIGVSWTPVIHNLLSIIDITRNPEYVDNLIARESCIVETSSWTNSATQEIFT